METNMTEQLLVQWYKDLYISRTLNPQSILDYTTPEYRISWSEVALKMKSLGYKLDPIGERFEWDDIERRHKLTRWKKTIRRTT